MNKIAVTKTVCRQIVRLGTEFRMIHSQKSAAHPASACRGHLTGSVSWAVEQDSTRTGYGHVQVGDSTFKCFCPLLPPGGRIERGTIVCFGRNRVNGHWEIFAAECY